MRCLVRFWNFFVWCLWLLIFGLSGVGFVSSLVLFLSRLCVSLVVGFFWLRLMWM